MMQASFLLIDRNRHRKSTTHNSVPAFIKFICYMAGNLSQQRALSLITPRSHDI